MKLLCVSDLHLDVVTMGVRRLSELRDGLAHVIEVAIANKVDRLVFLGDLCDPDSGPTVFDCLDAAMGLAVTLKSAGIRSIFLAGNHDVKEDGTGTTTLTPLRHVAHVVERPASWGERARGGPLVNFVGLPFTATSHPYDPAEALREHLRGDMPNVVLSHLSVPGIIPGEETTEMPRGREVTLPLELLAREDVLVIQGHFHRQQVHKHMGATVHVVGSLARLTFGEEQHDPAYLMVEVG